jgi:hypothetical protein
MNTWLAESYLLVTLVFVVGTLSMSFAAAQIWPTRSWLAAIAAGLIFEADLLLIVQPGLSLLAILIALACTTLLALLGGLMARRAAAR